MAKINGMRSVLHNRKVILGAVIVALACAWVCMSSVHTAWALDAGVYTADLSASYVSPDTGEIADAGGDASQEIGTSMVEGIAGEHALIEVDASGAVTATVRFGQADQLGDVSVSCDATHADAFGKAVVADIAQVNEEQNTADYRFAMPDEDATIRFDMYVDPMGRNVTFFGQIKDPVEGNTDGFIETVDTSMSAQDATAQDTGAQPADDTGTDAGASDALNEQAAAADPDSAADSQSGVREFTSDGAEATGVQDGAEAASGLNYPLIIGVIAIVVVVVLLVVYVAIIRPKKARQEQAAKAAAGNGRFEGHN